MNQIEARNKLQQILEERMRKDILFSETKFSDGTGFVDHHMRWIAKHSGGGWNEEVALKRVAEVQQSMAYPPED